MFSPEGFGVRLPYALLAHNYMRATPSPLCATPCFGTTPARMCMRMGFTGCGQCARTTCKYSALAQQLQVMASIRDYFSASPAFPCSSQSEEEGEHQSTSLVAPPIPQIASESNLEYKKFLGGHAPRPP